MVAKNGNEKKKMVEAREVAQKEDPIPKEEKEEDISAENTVSKGGKPSVKDSYFRDDDSSEEKVDANLPANPGKRKRCVHKSERKMKQRKKNQKGRYRYKCNQKNKKGPGGPGGGDGGGNDPGAAGGSMGIAA